MIYFPGAYDILTFYSVFLPQREKKDKESRKYCIGSAVTALSADEREGVELIATTPKKAWYSICIHVL
jgi:hypothetical protein